MTPCYTCRLPRSSKNDVNNNQIAALITHMEDCHPKLKEELNNLSYVVAVIVPWGAPPELLAIELIRWTSTRTVRSTTSSRSLLVLSMPSPGSSRVLPRAFRAGEKFQ